MLKRSILALLISLSLVFFVVGCGGSETTDADTDVKEVETTETTDDKDAATDDLIVGSWTTEGVVEDGTTTIEFTFAEDGTFKLFESLEAGQPGEGIDEQESATGVGEGTYTVDGDKLTLTYDSLESEDVTYNAQKIKDDLMGQDLEYTYEISGDTLTLTDEGGHTETLTRVTTD